jgi:hypothetical protein
MQSLGQIMPRECEVIPYRLPPAIGGLGQTSSVSEARVTELIGRGVPETARLRGT